MKLFCSPAAIALVLASGVIVQSAAAPAFAQTATVAAPAPSADGFKPLGAWAVRVDRVENPREDRLVHVYLTLRNIGTTPLVQTERIAVLFEDSLGITVEGGQGLRAQPGYPKLFDSPPPITQPGQEIQTKFVFDRNKGARTVSITVEESREHSATFDF